MHKSDTGTWLPAWVPESTATLSILLLICSMVQSTTHGYDGSMLNGLNILPSYTDYFKLTAATTGLNTASVFIGNFLGTIFSGILTDRLGRRPAIFWSAIITIAGNVLQTCAQNIAMFIIARMIMGWGIALSGIAGATYLSETFPSRYRAWGVGLLNNFYYIGALIAAGITLNTSKWESTWAWRAPSLCQVIFSVGCIVILPFIPESPRWLVRQELYEAARHAVADCNSRGDIMDPVAIAIYKEIFDTLEWEKREGKTTSPKEIVKDPVSLKRVLIGGSPGPFSCIAGNIIASYYLGPELKTAGITESQDQLKANVVLNVWCLACALTGTLLASKWGRKPTAILSQSLLIFFLFLIGGLSKIYASDPEGASKSLVYGDVAVMFMFQGAYSVAWTPLATLYPPEVMNYAIRANGLAASHLVQQALAVVLVFSMPIALANLGWKMYFVNGSWDIITLILIIVFWVETKGKTLEEIDAIFMGEKHSTVPNIEDIRTGKKTLEVDEVKEAMAVQEEEKAR